MNKDFRVKLEIFSYPSVLTCVLGAQRNRLIETVLLSTHNMFWLINRKIKFPLRTLNRSHVHISNVNPYHANNIFVLKLSFVTVDMTDMYWIYTCLKALYLI